jgi:uncharacterized protein YutE (UPF0331/DUF86 family)
MRWPAARRERSRRSVTSSVGTSTKSRVVDRDRVLAKLDELDGYLAELRSIAPSQFEEYLRVERKRACERLAQVAVEAALDVCALLVTGLRLGLPGEEDDLVFEVVSQRLVDFETFKAEVLAFLRTRNPSPCQTG